MMPPGIGQMWDTRLSFGEGRRYRIICVSAAWLLELFRAGGVLDQDGVSLRLAEVGLPKDARLIWAYAVPDGAGTICLVAESESFPPQLGSGPLLRENPPALCIDFSASAASRHYGRKEPDGKTD